MKLKWRPTIDVLYALLFVAAIALALVLLAA